MIYIISKEQMCELCMATCSDPHLGYLQANILHKINYTKEQW